MKKKRLPLWMVLTIDILVFAIALCAFAYFHHIRILWAPFHMVEPTSLHNFVNSEKVGDFSERFGMCFSESKTVNLKDDKKIRSFLTELNKKIDAANKDPENNFANVRISETEKGKYIGLYQSKDILLTVEKVYDNSYKLVDGKTARQTYYVYDIYIRHVENLYTSAYEQRAPMSTLINNVDHLTNAEGKQFATQNPIAAINGDYWGNTNHTMTALRNGKLYIEADTIESDILVLYYDGSMETYKAGSYSKDHIEVQNPYQIWNFGPALMTVKQQPILKDGDFDPDLYDPNVITASHPRTGIGYYEPGHYCFVTVEGRHDKAAGMYMTDFSNLFYNLGCTKAYNMDGGGSCQAHYDGNTLYNGDGRKLFDIICIGEINTSAGNQRSGGDQS